VAPEEVLGPARPGRRFVVSGDTRPCAALERAAADADLLVHEATFADADRPRALETGHSTGREAAQLARRAGVHRLLLTHFSSRYEDNLTELAREAREEYPAAQLAHDGLTLELPLR
jgi:ribonuclease Z